MEEIISKIIDTCFDNLQIVFELNGKELNNDLQSQVKKMVLKEYNKVKSDYYNEY